MPFVQALIVLLLLFRILLSVSLWLNRHEPVFLKPGARTRAQVSGVQVVPRGIVDACLFPASLNTLPGVGKCGGD